MERQQQNEEQQTKQQVQLNPVISPPSSSSSPSHEFSFTISLHPSSAIKIPDNKTKSHRPFAIIDLSPADEIFFHGQLLPLHLPVSPRRHVDTAKELLQDYDNDNNKTTINGINDDESSHVLEGIGRGKSKSKSKSFSLFGMPRQWRKGYDQAKKDGMREKRKSKFEVIVKRYMRLVNPFILLRNYKRSENQELCSYSGNLRVRSKKQLRGKRGELSAPASMRTSPRDSGILIASGGVTPTKSDSTMEELQAAIQSAIAHCKNSIAAEDRLKLP